MAWLTGNERVFLRAVSHLGYSNPFLPERITYEREALGADFVEAEAVWNVQVDQPDAPLTNTTHIMQAADVAVFKPLKAGWATEVRNWKFETFQRT